MLVTAQFAGCDLTAQPGPGVHCQQPRAGGAQPRVLDPGGGRGAGLGALHRRRLPPQHGPPPRHQHRGLHRHVRRHHRDRQQVPGGAHCNVQCCV